MAKKKSEKPAAKAVTSATPVTVPTTVQRDADPAEWIRFTEGAFRLDTGKVVRFLYKEPKGEKPLLREGKVLSLYRKNYMTFVKIQDLADNTEKDVMLQSIIEVQR
jgi:hypothetical protein